MSGWIYTECPECGELLRVWVDFPSPTEGFKTREYTCKHCGSKNTVKDKHVYKDGKIVGIEE